MTLEEIKTEKAILERNILSCVNEFTERTSVNILDINILPVEASLGREVLSARKIFFIKTRLDL